MTGTASDEPLIEVSALEARFGSLKVFGSLDFTIRAGEFVSFLGPSGCGKSTLLRILAGLIPCSAGRVRVGLRTGGEKTKIGLIFQKPLLLPWRTAVENVTLPAELRNAWEPSSAARVARARRMLEIVRLGDFCDAYPHQLSGGMQQRVAIARALMADPEVLLMDEPFGALDENSRQAMNEEMVDLWQSAATRLKTIVMVTHSIADAVAMSDRVFLFGPRPAALRHSVEIPFGRPRTVEEPRLADTTLRVRALLQALS